MVRAYTLNDLESQNNYRSNGFYNTYYNSGSRPSVLAMMFPGFKIQSFTFIMSCTLVVIQLIDIILSNNYYWNRFIYSVKYDSGLLVQEGKVWCLITCIFFHANFLHLLFNVLGLFNLGFITEAVYGSLPTLCIYMITGILANLFSTAISPLVLSVGASGAILGFIGVRGAQIALFWDHLVNREIVIWSYIINVSFMLLFNLVSPGVNTLIHLLGLIIGFLLGLSYPKSSFTLPP